MVFESCLTQTQIHKYVTRRAKSFIKPGCCPGRNTPAAKMFASPTRSPATALSTSLWRPAQCRILTLTGRSPGERYSSSGSDVSQVNRPQVIQASKRRIHHWARVSIPMQTALAETWRHTTKGGRPETAHARSANQFAFFRAATRRPASGEAHVPGLFAVRFDRVESARPARSHVSAEN